MKVKKSHPKSALSNPGESNSSERGKDGNCLRVNEILRDLGFRSDAPESTSRALVLNLIRNAYGEEAARSALRLMNQELNRTVLITEFVETSINTASPIRGEEQLSFFDLAESVGNSTHQRKSS